VAYWESKFERNRMRDRRNLTELHRLGWQVIIVWECQLRKPNRVLQRLENALAGAPPYALTTAGTVPLAAESRAKYKSKAKKGPLCRGRAG
jgi:G:T-mismatch repair DNA endonuclease (very short patch repair protein)